MKVIIILQTIIELNYLNIVLNIILTGIIATLITNLAFFVIFRLFQYDYVFLEETSSVFSKESSIQLGFMIHVFIGISVIAIYAIPYQLLLSIFTDNEFGIYRFDPVAGTAIQENLNYFLPLTLLIFLIWLFISYLSKSEGQKILLFLYSIVFAFTAGIVFGLYGLGLLTPGILYT